MHQTKVRMTGDSAKKQWATARDWNEHRKQISDLYCKHKLEEVMRSMESKGFHATEKMYKQHIKQWKLDNKNLKHFEARAMMYMYVHRKGIGKESRFIVRGREISAARITEYCRRRGWRIDDIMNGPRPSTPDNVECCTPGPSIVAMPTDLAEPELMLRRIGEYVAMQIEMGSWIDDQHGHLTSATGPEERKSYDILDRIIAATSRFSSEDFTAGGLILRKAALAFDIAIKHQQPRVLMKMLHLPAYLSRYPEILCIVLKQIVGMCRVSLGESHLLSRICSAFFHQELWTNQELIDTAMQRLADSFQESLSFAHREAQYHKRGHLCTHQRVHSQGTEMLAQKLISKCGETWPGLSFETYVARMDLISVYFRNKSHEKLLAEAQALAKDIEDFNIISPAEKRSLSTEIHYMVAFVKQEQQQQQQLQKKKSSYAATVEAAAVAESPMRTAIRLQTGDRGRYHAARLHRLSELERLLFSWGDKRAAAELSREMALVTAGMEAADRRAEGRVACPSAEMSPGLAAGVAVKGAGAIASGLPVNMVLAA